MQHGVTTGVRLESDVVTQAARRRSFAVISHPDAGKSTLTEALALHAHAITEAGHINGKSGRRHTVSDWMDMEQARGISITSASLQFSYRDTVINLLDTPGHADFSEDTYRVLSAVDAAVMLVDAAKGLEAQTMKLFAVCKHRGIPLITVINKWDRPGLDALALMDEITERTGLNPTPLTWPVGVAGDFRGVLDRATGAYVRFTPSAGGAHIAPQETLSTADRIRTASRVAARALAEVGRAIVPGVTTDELDRIGHEYLVDNGAYPSTLGYRGFPKSLCTSVNEVICHGIPDSTVLVDGDIVNIDITAYLDGVHGDNNATFPVGEVDERAALLIERTRESLDRAIRAVVPGREINIIGRVIEKYAQRFGYGVVRDYTGHGVGESFHSGLVIPHYDAAPDYSTVIEPGMVFTIEPMLTLGTAEWTMWDDGWTVLTADGDLTAQFEHTLLVTPTGAEILTLP